VYYKGVEGSNPLTSPAWPLTARVRLSGLLLGFVCATTLLAAATANRDLALRASSETAPAGGCAQIKVFAATPHLVAGGSIAMAFDPARRDTESGFFGERGRERRRALGDGKFINATTHLTPMVRIDLLNDAYWTKLPVAARRVK
jgi:hypothetical protein